MRPLIFLLLGCGMLLGSCVRIETIRAPSVTKSVTAEDDSSYVSSIIIDNGLNETEHLIELTYAAPLDTSFTEVIVSNPQFEVLSISEQSVITFSSAQRDIAKTCYQRRQVLEFSDFFVPICWTEEGAELYGTYQFAVIEPQIELLPVEVIRLDDEQGYQVCFERYLVKCSALIKNTENNIQTATSSIIVKVPRYPITFDRPNVDDWTEEEVEI